MPTVRLSGLFGPGLYRIGGLLFRDGVAEVDEISHADREVIKVLGATVDGENDSASDENAAPPAAGDPETASQPESAPTSAFADPSPETGAESVVPTSDAQAAAAPHESGTVSSETDGSTVETAPLPTGPIETVGTDTES